MSRNSTWIHCGKRTTRLFFKIILSNYILALRFYFNTHIQVVKSLFSQFFPHMNVLDHYFVSRFCALRDWKQEQSGPGSRVCDILERGIRSTVCHPSLCFLYFIDDYYSITQYNHLVRTLISFRCQQKTQPSFLLKGGTRSAWGPPWRVSSNNEKERK